MGTTAYDSDGNNNGNLIGTTLPEWQNEENCISGKCLSFNGSSSYINIPTNQNLHNSNLSVSLWFKLNSINPDGNVGTILISDYGSPNDWIFYVLSSGVICLRTHPGGSTCSSAGLISTNQWYHTTFTITNNSSEKIYLNSKNVANGNYTNTSSSNAIKIGTASWAPGNNTLNGYLDEVKIYPYARTADQIKLDYNSRGSSKGSSVNLGIKSNTAPDLKSKLVAHYKFDENQGLIATNSVVGGTSLNGIFGSGSYTPTWTNDGKSSKALIFDGINDFIRIPQSSPINSLTQFTFSFWIKHDGTNVDNYIFYKGSASPSFTIGINGNGMGQEYWTTAGTRTTATIINNISPNQWHHIVFTFKENTFARSYLDGKLIQNNSSISSIRVNSEDLYFNTYAGTVGSYNVKGLFDEVKIYNTALTDEEIKQDYNQGSAIQFGATNQTIGGTTTSLEYCIPGDTSHCASPIAEWNFEENNGTSTYDTSGNNNTGTFGTGNSAPTWTVGKKNTGAGLNFDGNDYLNLGSLSDSSTSHTFNFWVKSSITPTTTISLLDSQIGRLIIAWSDGNMNGKLGFYDGSWKNSNISAPKDGNWHFLSYVLDAGTSLGTIYIDGIGQTTLSYNPTVVGTQSNIGSRYSQDQLFFTGKIDHVKIYNYARTPAQVAYDYNKGGPIAHWKLDECQGLTAFDSSGSGYTGSISIGPSGSQNTAGTCQVGTSAAWTTGASGKINSSLNFDGTDDYFVTSQPLINTSPNYFTVAGFINPENQTGYILTPFSCGYDQRIAYSASSQNLIVSIAENADTNERSRTSTNNSIPVNKWTHFAVSINDKDIKIYINGNLNSQYTETIGICGWTSNWYFGQRGINTSWFKGKMDDMRVYNYPLTPDQVKTVYNNGAVTFN